MISLYLVSPGTSSLAYARVRQAIHYGCGHGKIAVCESDNNVTCDAVPNLLRSNTKCLRLTDRSASLTLSSDHDEIVLLQHVLNRFRSLGFRTSFATPDERVSLAFSPSLLIAKQRNQATGQPGNRATSVLRRKYSRIAKKHVTDRRVPVASKKYSGELTY